MILGLGLLSLTAGGRAASAIGQPQVNERVVATYFNGQITLTGSRFGLPISQRSLRFDYDSTSTTLASSDPAVQSWGATSIVVNLPPAIHTGRVTVIVDGQSSAGVDLYVYILRTSPTALPSNGSARPLAVTTTPDGRLWIDEEFHREIKVLTNALSPSASAVNIPQFIPPGIYANNLGGADGRTPVSALGEDVETDTDGSIWLTDGGAFLYAGQQINTSRIIHYTPASGAFACYNVPGNDAEVFAVVIDHARGMVWYSESSPRGNAIGGFSISGATSACQFNPDADAQAPLCSVQQVPACHQHFALPTANSQPTHLVLDGSGNIWFPEYSNNKIARLNPTTGALLELPLPPPIVRQGPGSFVGSGPFEIDIDANGDLWVAEYFDATVDRIQPSRLATNDCTHLDTMNHNPCIDEIFVGSNGLDGITIHTLNVGPNGLVWFSLSGSPAGFGNVFNVLNGNASRPGVISIARGNAVALLPPLPNVPDLAGIVQDPISGDVWFAEYSNQAVGRLQDTSNDGDTDGVPNQIDNCPTTSNPDQKNTDHDPLSLAAWSKPYKDATRPNGDAPGDACDPDADNDGLSNTVESALGPGGASHASCPSATANTDSLLLDTDGDRVTDGTECQLGTDPADANSHPTTADCAASLGVSAITDSDGDGVRDGVEFCYYNTDPHSANTDGDGCGDAREIASINADLTVNSTDLQQVAVAFGPSSRPQYIPDFDSDKNGNINSTDLQFLAVHFGPCP